MDFEESLKKHLDTYAGLKALTSNRWYPITADQNTKLPYGTYQLISGPYDETLDGISDHAIHQYQFSIYGNSQASVNAVAKQLKKSFQDAIPGVLGTGFEVQGVSLKGNSGTYTNDTQEYQRDMDFEFQFDEE